MEKDISTRPIGKSEVPLPFSLALSKRKSMMMDVGKHANASGKPPPYSYCSSPTSTSTESSPPLTPAPPRKRTLSTSSNPSNYKKRNSRSRSSSSSSSAASFLFTPSSPPILVGPRTGPRLCTTSSSTPSSPPPYHATLPLPLPSTLNFTTYTDPPQTPRSRSSPHLASSRPGQHLHLRATTGTTDQHHQRYTGDTSDDEQDRSGGMIFTSPRRVYVDGEASGSATSFRSRSSTTQALLHSTSVVTGAVGGGGSGSGSGSRGVKVREGRRRTRMCVIVRSSFIVHDLRTTLNAKTSCIMHMFAEWDMTIPNGMTHVLDVVVGLPDMDGDNEAEVLLALTRIYVSINDDSTGYFNPVFTSKRSYPHRDVYMLLTLSTSLSLTRDRVHPCHSSVSLSCSL